MADISKITDLSGATHTIKDSTAREAIDSLRDAMNALSAIFFEANIPASGSLALSVSNNFRGMLITSAASSARSGIYIVGSSSSGAIQTKAAIASSEIGITTSTRLLTIASSGATQTKVFVIVMGGTIKEA